MSKELLPSKLLLNERSIEECVYCIRGREVMIDSDVAYFFRVETKRLNEQMKRNIERFPEDFCFQLTDEEYDVVLRSHFATSNIVSSKRRYNPFVYTEHGVISLAGVLRSEVATKMSVDITRMFIQMRKFVLENSDVVISLAKLQNRQLEFEIQTNKKIDDIIKMISKVDLPKQSLIYAGQFYDAYEFIVSIIRKARKSILIIDPYCDSKVFTFLKNKIETVTVCIIKSSHSKLSEDEIKIFEAQYGPVEVKCVDDNHDRYIIIDREECYQIGTSLNYAGKKMFSVIKNENKNIIDILVEINGK